MRMRAMVICTATVLCSSALVATRTWAGDCAFLGKDPLTLRDNQLFYLPPGGRDWVEVQPSSSALGNQTIEFAYIIQEKIDQARAGVAVVKSGRHRQLDEPAVASDKRVELVRNTQDSDPAACQPVPSSMTASISARSYDDYHDYGLRVPEQGVLDAFHYTYAGRNGSCRKTDSTLRDARSKRTNLGQFSFNPAVVRGEVGSQAMSYFTPSPAVAASDNLADQRVEIQAYRVRTGFPSCVHFSLKVPSKAAFVRINDLEGLKQDGRYYVRSDEATWTLSR
jgi:hypothetical protein